MFKKILSSQDISSHDQANASQDVSHDLTQDMSQDISRRKLLSYGMAGTALLGLGMLSACARKAPPLPPSKKTKTRTYPSSP